MNDFRSMEQYPAVSLAPMPDPSQSVPQIVAQDKFGAMQVYGQPWGGTPTIGFLVAGGARTYYFRTLDPGCNWDGADGNMLYAQQYRSRNMTLGEVSV